MSSPASQARRRGDKCWRAFRAEQRRLAAPVALPAMPSLPHRSGAAQDESLIPVEEVRTGG